MVFEGTVTRVESGRQGKEIATFVTFKVMEVIKGRYDGRLIVLKFQGGDDGEYGLRVHGMPEFKRGEKNILCLSS
ncbi:MAG: hypothetical protein HZA01_06325 [Nitrospinae bacterium]|nr:hypothetical protein [Nitrospinota bacterium]